MDTEFEQKLDLLDKIPFFDLFDVIEKNALTREYLLSDLPYQ
jgi:hypothetical protein